MDIKTDRKEINKTIESQAVEFTMISSLELHLKEIIEINKWIFSLTVW